MDDNSEKKEKDEEEIPSEKQEQISADIEKEQRVKQFEEKKKQEEEISNQAYNLMERASELAKKYEFDEALNLYNEAIDLLREINWAHEIQTIQIRITQLKKEKELYFKELEEKKAQEERDHQLKAEQEALLEEKARKIKEQKEREKSRKIEVLEKEKEFKQQIADMGDKADNMVREYESGIKKGNFELNPPYEKVIEIYKNIQEILLEKGWNDQAHITSNQMKLFQKKLEQDKKLREIEANKREKDKAYLEWLKK